MRIQQNSLAASPQFCDNVPNVAPSERIEGGGRFVQNNQIRVMQKRLRQSHALLHPPRKLPDSYIQFIAKPDALQHCRNAPLAAFGIHARQFSMQIQEFVCSKEVVELEFFGQKSHLSPRFHVADRFAEQKRAAGSRARHSKQHLNGRGFPRSVRPQKPKDLTGRHNEIEVIYSDVTTVRFAQRPRFDCHCACDWICR